MAETPRTVLLTPRLRLRGARPDDFEPLLASIFSDPQVMQYLSWPTMDRAQARAVFEQHFDHDGDGTRVGVLVERDGGEVLGYAGLKACDALGADDLEMGFVLRPSAWGRGYASEVGQAQLQHGFTHGGRPRVLAQVRPENAASVHALRKLGMHFVKAHERPGLGHWHVYSRERDA